MVTENRDIDEKESNRTTSRVVITELKNDLIVIIESTDKKEEKDMIYKDENREILVREEKKSHESDFETMQMQEMNPRANGKIQEQTNIDPQNVLEGKIHGTIGKRDHNLPK